MSSKVASFLFTKLQNWSNPPQHTLCGICIYICMYICMYICTSAMDTISLGKVVIPWDEFVTMHKTLYMWVGRGAHTTITTGTRLLL